MTGGAPRQAPAPQAQPPRSRAQAQAKRPLAAGLRPRRAGPLTAGVAATVAAVGITVFAIAIHHPAGPGLPKRGSPPWSRPADTAVGAHLAGLTMSGAAGEVTRYYLHLDVFVNNKRVTVPAYLGVDRGTGAISALHTWDSSGVVQVESNAAAPRYTLGQLFDVWQVPLSSTQLGGLQTSRRNSLSVYVNGQKVRGDPRSVTLAPQQEIAIVFGAGPSSPPASYQFPPAE